MSSADASARDDRINLRATTAQKNLISAAAVATNRSVSEFLLGAALKEASETLLDQRVFFATNAELDALEAIMNERPPRESEELEQLFSRKAPWE